MEPAPTSTPPPGTTPGAGGTLLVLLAPALVIAVLGSLTGIGPSAGVGPAFAILAIGVALIGGPIAGFIAARRLRRGVAAGCSPIVQGLLTLACVATSVIACFGGCVLTISGGF